MAFGYLNVAYNSKVTPYDDEKTPLDLTGVKMLPIIKDEDGAMNESLDIIAKYDTDNKLGGADFLGSEEHKALDELLNRLGKNVHSLAMPYWIWTPEFDDNSRQYFQTKKELKRGPFSKLVQNSEQFIQPLMSDLQEIEAALCPYFESNQLHLRDIMLSAHLWGLFIVPEFRIPPKLYTYLMKVKSDCAFNYHEDFWK
jgi:glutaredoxin 2